MITKPFNKHTTFLSFEASHRPTSIYALIIFLSLFLFNIAQSQELDIFTDESSSTTAPVTNLRMAKITANNQSGNAPFTSTQVVINGTLSTRADINVWWNTVDDFATASQVGVQAAALVGTPYDISMVGAGSGSGYLYYTITLPGNATGNFTLTVNSMTGATTDNIPLPASTSSKAVSSQVLNIFTDDSTHANVPSTDMRMATISSPATGDGTGLTSTQVAINGTLSEITDIKVWWNTLDNFSTATQVGTQSSAIVGTTYDISLTGVGNASGYMYYSISVPGGATGDYTLTINSVTGSTADNIPLPASTASKAVSTQTLDTFTDDSVNSVIPVTDLRLAKITSTATGNGTAINSTQVIVNGTLSALTDIKVWWNTIDNFATATLVGTQASALVGTTYDIALTGAGNGTGYLYYTISIPGGASGNYTISVNSASGATSDNIPLPAATASKSVSTQELYIFADNSSNTTVPAIDLRMVKILTTATSGGAPLSSTQIMVNGTLSALSNILVWWNTVDDFATASLVGSQPSALVGTTYDVSLSGAGSVSGYMYYTISIPGGAAGDYTLTVNSVTGSTADTIPLPASTVSKIITGTQELDLFTDNSSNAGAPVTDLRIAKITSSATGGGTGLTSTQLVLNGTLSAVTDIKVWWNTIDDFATATQIGSQATPATGASYDIALTGSGSGSGYLYYTMSIPAGASGNYTLTVNSVTGSTADNIPLPSSTSLKSVNVSPTQELNVFTDDSSNTNASVNNLKIAKIATTASGGGENLTSTQVILNGSLSAVSDIRVWWNTVDDFGTAIEVGSEISPAMTQPYNISLTGAGNTSGYIYYTITIPAGATGSYALTINSVLGSTTDNVGLPVSTASKSVNTQDLDTFTDDSVITTVPVTDFRIAKISTSAGGNGITLSSTRVIVNGTVSSLTDIKVWWNTVDNFSTAVLAGSQAGPTSGTPYDITLTSVGNASGFLYYTVSIPGGATGSYALAVNSVTGSSSDSIPLPTATASRTINARQELDNFIDISANTNVPVTDFKMAKITSTATGGGSSLTLTQVAVNGTLSAITDIKVWWNTVDDFATSVLAGSQAGPIIGTAYDITLTGVGNASGYLYYTVSLPGGATGNMTLTVNSVSGATADNIPLPASTAPRSIVATNNPDSPTLLAQFKSDGLTVLPDSGYTNETSIVIQADINDPDAGDTIKLQVDLDSDGTVDCEEAILGANPRTAVQVTCTVIDNTQYDWSARTIDNNGAVSSWIAQTGNPPSPDFTTDFIEPSYTWNTPASGSYYNDGSTISIEVSITENGSGVLNGADCQPMIDGVNTTFTGLVNYTSGKCTGTLTLNNPSGLTDGVHNLTVQATDRAGNSTQSAVRIINIDSTAPSSTIFDPLNSASLNMSDPNPYTISGNASDNTEVQGIEISINSGAWTPAICTGCPGANVTWSYDWTMIADGVHMIQTRATDSSGNTETAGAEISVSVDISSPALSTTMPADNASGIALNSDVTIDWNEPVDCATVNTTNISINSGGLTLFSCAGSQAVFTASTQNYSTIYTVTVTTSVLDTAGNPMAAPYMFIYTTIDPGAAGLAYPAPPYDNGVDPDSGDTTTSFTFKVNYIDGENDAPAPGFPKIYIGDNDSYYSYTMTEEDPGDTTYTDGKTYFFTNGFGAAEDMRYYFEAKAATGNPTLASLPVGGSTYIAGPDVYLLSGYNLVGVPKYIASNTWTYTSLLGDDTGYLYCGKWDSIGLDTISGAEGSWNYYTYGVMNSGNGYYVWATDALKRLDEPSSIVDEPRSSVDIPLDPEGGWSVITNPYNAIIELQNVFVVRGGTEYTYSDAVTNGWVSNSIYEWEGSGPGYTFRAFNDSTPATLDPWLGYFIYVNDAVPTTLRFYAP